MLDEGCLAFLELILSKAVKVCMSSFLLDTSIGHTAGTCGTDMAQGHVFEESLYTWQLYGRRSLSANVSFYGGMFGIHTGPGHEVWGGQKETCATWTGFNSEGGPVFILVGYSIRWLRGIMFTGCYGLAGPGSA